VIAPAIVMEATRSSVVEDEETNEQLGSKRVCALVAMASLECLPLRRLACLRS
jgi:hypothetical protein